MHELNTMDPISWLCDRAIGFKELSNYEREAIMHFTLLWSFFEARVLNTNASAEAICELVKRWKDQYRLRIEHFVKSIEYFRSRYFNDGVATNHFAGLNLRGNDRRELVEAVLRGENTDPVDSVVVLLIIIFRLRNNLFHGIKWAYGIRGQLDNFTHANYVLMTALDLNDSLRMS